jgi:hypothetical protein
MHLYFTDRAHPITRDVSNWAMDDEIYYDMDLSPEARVLATAYTPKAIDTGGRGNREAQQRAAEAVAAQEAVNIYDIQPQMWTYERTLARRPQTLPRLRLHPRPPLYQLQPPQLPRPPPARHRLGRPARQRRRTLPPRRTRRRPPLPRGRPHPPASAAAKIEVHPEFNLSLVAAEPLINKVMNIDWDEKGRLWVCETPEYPNGRRKPKPPPTPPSPRGRTAAPPFLQLPPGADRDPEDRISILTDTNGDGVMDKKHVFADQLELVTSFVFYKNGVIAATAPDIWFSRTRTATTSPTNAPSSTPASASRHPRRHQQPPLGPRRLDLRHARLLRGDVKSGDGTEIRPGGSGVVRFKPDGSAFEQYSSKNGNTWGLDITWDGQVFWTQPTSGTVFFHSCSPRASSRKARCPAPPRGRA